MRDEVAAAVVFLTRLVRTNSHLSKDKADEFSDKLSTILVERFKNHWYQKQPTKGQGYRCIRVNEAEPVDTVLEKVAQQSGLSYLDLGLPSEFTLWIDPQEVICRIGENGCAAYLNIATFREDEIKNQSQTLDLDTILRTHQTHKNNELAKFQEAARNRNQRNKPVRNYFNTGKKPSYGDGQPFFKPKSYHSHGFAAPQSGRRSASPKVTMVPDTCSADGSPVNSFPVMKDRFHWVRPSGEMLMAAQ